MSLSSYYLGLMTGIIFAGAVLAGIFKIWLDSSRKSRHLWLNLIGKDILFQLNASRQYSRKWGKPVRALGEIKQGRVQHVRQSAKLVQIDGHWYRWSQVTYIDAIDGGQGI
jgi:hypothetical protein